MGAEEFKHSNPRVVLLLTPVNVAGRPWHDAGAVAFGIEGANDPVPYGAKEVRKGGEDESGRDGMAGRAGGGGGCGDGRGRR